MPGIILFGRRWKIGSDDFVFPGAAEIFLRFAWLIALSVVYHIHKQTTLTCDGSTLLHTYYIGIISLLCVTLLLAIIIVYISMKGSITETYPRKAMAKLLYVKLAITVPELVWNILGTYWSFWLSEGCENHVVYIIRGAVLCGWLLVFIMMVGFLVVFDPLGGGRHKNNQHALESGQQMITSAKMAAKKVWTWRCRLLCCCLMCDDDSKSAFGDIASLISEFFQGLDLVPTDIAAGLILVQRKQEAENCQLTNISSLDDCHQRISLSENNMQQSNAGYATFSPAVTSHRSSLSSNGTSKSERNSAGASVEWQPQDWMSTTLMAHYMKFAMASYGWPLYVFANLSTGICRLYKQCQCCSCKQQIGHIVKDNCCMCNVAAIKQFTDIDDAEILHASFHNEIYAIPYFVAIDRKEKAVVISVRGTLSLKDALTDLTADCDKLDLENNCECDVHRGILQAAKYVKSQLETDLILEKAFQKAQGAHLVITGHSLGAGAAALLAIMLKPTYPDLICYAFSPPGGLMSLTASCCCSDYICSIVLGKDLVPRLGLLSMENLKTEVLHAISSCQLPKFRILASGMMQVFCGICSKQDNVSQSLLPKENRASITSQQLQEAIQNAVMQNEQYKITYPALYPPGRVLHIVQLDTYRSCCSKPTYYAEWKKAEDFNEIIVSPDMLTDHLPDNVMEALEQLADKNFTPKPSNPVL